MKKVGPDDIYSRASLKILIGLSFLGLSLGFWINFSLEERLVSFVQTQLKKNAPCSLKYDRLGIFYFPPGLWVENLKIPARCHPSFSMPLQFSDAHVRLTGFDFSMFVPVISFKAQGGKDLLIRGELAASGQNLAFSLEETQIDGVFLTNILSSLEEVKRTFGISLDGKLVINTEIELQEQGIHSLEFSLASQDLKLPSLKVRGFNLPAIDIGILDIRLEVANDGEKLILKRFSLGSKESTLMAILEGEIDLLRENFLQSQVKIQTRFRFAPSFLDEDMGQLLKLYLERFYHEEDEFYHVNISNTLENMQFQ